MLAFEELDIVLFLWNYFFILAVFLLVRAQRYMFGVLARFARRVMMGLTRGGQGARRRYFRKGGQ